MEKKRELKPYHGLIGFVVVFLMLIASGYFGGRIARHLGIWYSVICEVLIPLVGIAIILIRKADIRETFPFSLPPVKMFISSVGLYVGTTMLSGAFNTITSRFIPNFSERGDSINALVVSMSPVLAVITIALVPAVCEEVFCRGFLLSTLKSVKNEALIITVIAVAFGALHMDLYAFIPTALMGGLFAFITLRTGSLLIPMILHFFNNAVSVISAYSLNKAEGNPAEILPALSVPAVVGYVMFYLGLAFIFLYLSGMVFTGKKFRMKKTIAVVAVSMVLIFVGNMTAALSSVHVVAMESTEFTYEAGLEKHMDLELDKGKYVFQVTAISENEMQITLEKEGKTVLASEKGMRTILANSTDLEKGTYTLTFKTVGKDEKSPGKVEIGVSVIRVQ